MCQGSECWSQWRARKAMSGDTVNQVVLIIAEVARLHPAGSSNWGFKTFYWSQQGNPGMRNTRVPWVPAVPHSRLSHSKGSGGDCIRLLSKDVQLEPWETSPGKYTACAQRQIATIRHSLSRKGGARAASWASDFESWVSSPTSAKVQNMPVYPRGSCEVS